MAKWIWIVGVLGLLALCLVPILILRKQTDVSSVRSEEVASVPREEASKVGAEKSSEKASKVGAEEASAEEASKVGASAAATSISGSVRLLQDAGSNRFWAATDDGRLQFLINGVKYLSITPSVFGVEEPILWKEKSHVASHLDVLYVEQDLECVSVGRVDLPPGGSIQHIQQSSDGLWVLRTGDALLLKDRQWIRQVPIPGIHRMMDDQSYIQQVDGFLRRVGTLEWRVPVSSEAWVVNTREGCWAVTHDRVTGYHPQTGAILVDGGGMARVPPLDNWSGSMMLLTPDQLVDERGRQRYAGSGIVLELLGDRIFRFSNGVMEETWFDGPGLSMESISCS